MRFIFAFSFVILISFNLAAQKETTFEIGGGVIIFPLMPGMPSYQYDNGFNINAAFSYKIKPTTSLLFNFGYHRSTAYYQTTPFYYFVPYGYPADISFKSYELSIGARVDLTNQPVKGYFTGRTGLLWSKIPNQPGYYAATSALYYENGWYYFNETSFFFAPGLGLSVELSPEVNLLLEGKYYFTTGTLDSFFPITAALQYKF